MKNKVKKFDFWDKDGAEEIEAENILEAIIKYISMGDDCTLSSILGITEDSKRQVWTIELKKTD